jgi:hypothetical protein
LRGEASGAQRAAIQDFFDDVAHAVLERSYLEPTKCIQELGAGEPGDLGGLR